ncbi:MAG: hypothetical protein M1828_007298 [Chrysothrix sp. TS-e1954]|nr:MAG: hypothetical protein M1828_007298 [Chrysothrix sp. TS-e1954]
MPVSKYQASFLTSLPSDLSYRNTTIHDIEKAVSLYPSFIPTDLVNLDRARYDTIPASIKARSTQTRSHLEKAELVELMRWKLKHGTYRPRLLSLIESNDAATVRETTRDAFSKLPVGAASDFDKACLDTLDSLTQLKGVGPATASLILSCYLPDTIPFFSDELFRWIMDPCADGEVLATKGKTGWDKGTGEIKYSRKEYAALLLKVSNLRLRLGENCSVSNLEKTAFVLGRVEGENILKGAEGAVQHSVKEQHEDEVEGKQIGPQATNDTSNGKSTSRKRTTSSQPVRVSKRLKRP